MSDHGTRWASLARSGPKKPPRRAGAFLDALADAYGRPEFFTDPGTFYVRPASARVVASHVDDLPDGCAIVDLRFRSEYEPFWAPYRDEHVRWKENLVAHARWYRSRAPRPVVVCLHGLGGGAYFFEERAFAVRYWLRAGLDVLLFQLPFHGRRRPPQAPRGASMFPSPHVVRTNEAFAQAVHDLRALFAWLRGQDVPEIGLWGMSLGGYTTALVASVCDDLAFAVPMIPAVSMSELMWTHGARTPARRAAEKAGVTRERLDRVFRVHAPLERPARVPANRRFLIAGRGDRITPPDQAQRLWEHWGRPPIHWFAGGHLAQVGRGGAFRALRRWLQGEGLLPQRPE